MVKNVADSFQIFLDDDDDYEDDDVDDDEG